MKDSIQAGTGNSRLILAKDWPDSYAQFRAMAERGELPIDLIVNAGGWTQLGMALNKANLLPDDVAARYNRDNTMSPADALGVLASSRWREYIFIGTSTSGGSSGSSGAEKNYSIICSPSMDLHGLWQSGNSTLLVPDGATKLLLTLGMFWGRQSIAQCDLCVKVNSAFAVKASAPSVGKNDAMQRETIYLPVDVHGGDEVGMYILADWMEDSFGTYLASGYANHIKIEIIR